MTPNYLLESTGIERIIDKVDSSITEQRISRNLTRRKTEGKPTQNACIESFNGKFRLENLRQHWLQSLAEAREIIENWRHDYNDVWPHRSLLYKNPVEVLNQIKISPDLSLEILKSQGKDQCLFRRMLVGAAQWWRKRHAKPILGRSSEV